MTDELEQIAKDVVDASVKRHIALGPGLLEPVDAGGPLPLRVFGLWSASTAPSQ
ncbi:MAG: hypothetical protein ACYTGL_05105 [Planctomycetota bacterium]|jgi:hypothetical protein